MGEVCIEEWQSPPSRYRRIQNPLRARNVAFGESTLIDSGSSANKLWQGRRPARCRFCLDGGHSGFASVVVGCTGSLLN